jgi:hypothetical protein
MIRVHFVEFELERHGLETPPSCQHCAPSSSILSGITLGGESLSGRLRCFGFWLRGIGVVFVPGTWQNKQLLDVLLSHNNHKRYPRKECCTH